MEKFTPPKKLKPENIQIGQSIQIHAQSLATFKTYVSRYNKGRTDKIKFEYADFDGAFCVAKRLTDETVILNA